MEEKKLLQAMVEESTRNFYEQRANSKGMTLGTYIRFILNQVKIKIEKGEFDL